MREIVLLGSTGSIGTQAVDIVRRNPDRFRVVGLGAAAVGVVAVDGVVAEVGAEGVGAVGCGSSRPEQPVTSTPTRSPANQSRAVMKRPLAFAVRPDPSGGDVSRPL